MRPKVVVTANYDRVLQWSNPAARIATNSQQANLADLFAAGFIGKQRHAFAHGRAPFGAQPDPFARGASVELRQDHIGPGKATRAVAAGAARLLNGPAQPGLDRQGGGVDIMAIKAQPGFQPQGIPRTQPGRYDAGRQQLVPDCDRGVRCVGPGEEAFGEARRHGQALPQARRRRATRKPQQRRQHRPPGATEATRIP